MKLHIALLTGKAMMTQTDLEETKLYQVQPLGKNCHGKVSLLFITLLLSLVLATIAAVHFLAPNNSQNAVSSQTQQAVSQNTSKQISGKAGEQTSGQQDLINSQQNDKGSFFSKFFSNQKNNKPAKNQTQTASSANNPSPEYLNTSYQTLYSDQTPLPSVESIPSISGRVLNIQGEAISNIVLTATLREYFKTSVTNTPKPKSQVLTATSNASGFFAFQNLPEGIYLLKTSNNKRYLPKSLETRSGVNYADIVLIDMQSMQLEGVVIDAASGQALANVVITPMVKGIPKSARTDAEGKFSLDFAVNEQATIPLRLYKEGFKKSRFSVDSNAWDTHQNLVLEMQTTGMFGELRGQVKGAGYSDMSGHLVKIYSPSLKQSYSSKTNQVGEYHIDKIEAASDYRIYVRPISDYKDFSKDGVKITSNSSTQDIQLEKLEQGYRLSGQVIDLENRPLANTTLALRSMSARNQVIPLTTDRHGAFSVENIPAGELVIETRNAPFYTLTGIDLSGANVSHYRDLVVDRGRNKLVGKIVDNAGEPVAAPKIYITTTRIQDGVRMQASRSTSADKDGNFLFTDLGAEQYTISVNAPGYRGTRLKHNMGNRAALVLKLTKEAI